MTFRTSLEVWTWSILYTIESAIPKPVLVPTTGYGDRERSEPSVHFLDRRHLRTEAELVSES